MPFKIILDTNVVSEIMRPEPDLEVVRWFSRQDSTALFTTTVTLAEVWYGINMMPAGIRRERFRQFARDFFETEMRSKVLAFDGLAATRYAELRAAKRVKGLSMSPLDAQIAGVALSVGGQIATRNTTDFEECGVPLINPWLG